MSTERKIGADLFRAEPLEATAALKLLLRLLRILGPGLQHLDRMLAEDEDERDAAAVAAFGAIALASDEDALAAFIVENVQSAQMRVNGAYDDIIFDIHLGGDLLLAFQIFAFVVEVNLGDLFDAGRRSPLMGRILAPRSEVAH